LKAVTKKGIVFEKKRQNGGREAEGRDRCRRCTWGEPPASWMRRGRVQLLREKGKVLRRAHQESSVLPRRTEATVGNAIEKPRKTERHQRKKFATSGILEVEACMR